MSAGGGTSDSGDLAAMSTSMSPEALEGSTPSVSSPGPAAQRLAAATPTQKAAMVNQAAIQQAAAGGNNITIDKAGDIQNNMSGGGGGESPVIVLKSPSNMPPIGSKIAYGMGL